MSMTYFGLWLGCAPTLFWLTGFVFDGPVRMMVTIWIWLAGLVWLLSYGMNIVWSSPPEAVGDYDDAFEKGMVLRFDQLKRKAQ